MPVCRGILSKIGTNRTLIVPIVQSNGFHSGRVLRNPNPYLKRPSEFPQPAEKPPRPPRTHPEHGLYLFFRNKKSVTVPNALQNHGRAWTAEELRRKSFEDLHVLWYKCIVERNIMKTEAHEARKQGIYFAIEGAHSDRLPVVKRTMARIKFVLWERYRAWWGAYQLNEQDPLLLDRMKEEEKLRRKKRIEAARARMTPAKLKRLEKKKRRKFLQRQEKRKLAELAAREQEMQSAMDAEQLKEFQKLAGGGRVAQTGV